MTGHVFWTISEEAREFGAVHVALAINEFYDDPIGRAGVRGAKRQRKETFVLAEKHRLQRLALEFGLDWDKATEHIPVTRRVQVDSFILGKGEALK